MAKSIKSGRILLAEDNKITQKFMGALLSKWGHQVTIVDDGNGVLDEISRNAFDILILDYQMPEMDGLSTYKLLKEGRFPNIENMQIIFLTGETSATVINDLKKSGVKYFLRKPIQKDVLFSTLSELLNIGVAQNSRINTTSTQYLKKITDTNPQLMREVIDIFIEEAPKFLFKMKTFCLLEDWESLRTLIHKIKANFAYVGMEEQKELLRKLEHDLEQMTDKETYLSRVIHLEKITQKAIVSLEKRKKNL
ncbi:response regulator [Litoribacter ruber]|uniref:response regulator n=1 Tax=Litoribacter ruber TaxID=702568 RepID=UPI001BD9C755|nr:response regulator [Litoribacter ruber]MBT0811290.1 response regulator [Litoribacter ruber]